MTTYIKFKILEKLFLLLLCLPMIGVASFPIITDDRKCERIAVPLDYDLNQKTDYENSKIEIINSPLEKGSPMKIIDRLLIIIILLLVTLLLIVIPPFPALG